ncbi:hypothetical protein JCM4814A_91960 [Streptomyces phaeofaciens JCM 4814]|uniref:Secreted protein n=1 Tax=Streptomyces phaeofaciens TaxID=68254 RepID=A0A918HK87_9ACTN|nr:hypothetical protein [Streptomyces phaeofaciens]GGT70428.1 hypothetical protein GCM10010226_55310 [Streptomyces phaeofaciens]
MSRIRVSRRIAAFVVAVATVSAPTAVAVLTAPPAVAAVHAFDDPPSSGEVDGQKDQVGKDTAQAKEDMAAAKGQATKCPPTSKECMSDLAGEGKEQKEGMAKTQQALNDTHPAPEDNASAVMDSTCDDFAAQLPAVLTSSGDSAELTGVCELMNP